jgi:hypothetical protein
MRAHAARNVLAAIVAATTMLSPGTASSQGLFDFLFGNLERAPPDTPPGADEPRRIPPRPPDRRPSERPAAGTGPRMAYCVRLCDGRFFPIEAYRNASAAVQCKSFCPATATKLFSGRGIEHAVARDGRRYADLPNSFVHRQRIVPGCTCNGRSAFGVARVPVAEDRTLQPTDIVATDSGLSVYRGRNSQQQAVFTPIELAKISERLRNQLAGVKVRAPLSTVEAGFAEGSQDEISGLMRPQLEPRPTFP